MSANVLELSTDCSCAPMGLRERQRIARGEAILDAAFELITDKGYVALTMEELADKVGISRPTLYHHFPNKEAIALKALIRLNEQSTDAILHIDPAVSSSQRFEAVVRLMVEARFTKTLAAFYRARPQLLPFKSQPEYLEVFERRVSLIRGIIEQAQQCGSINASLPSALVVQMLFGFLGSANYEDIIESGEMNKAQMIDSLTSTFLNGVKPQ